MKSGILIQGSITEWTPHIINEYKENFPEAEILLSTWNNENIGDIKAVPLNAYDIANDGTLTLV